MVNRLFCDCSSSEQPALGHWVNTTCLQIRALHSAHNKAKPTSKSLSYMLVFLICVYGHTVKLSDYHLDAGETQIVDDFPPPEGFRLDYTPV